MSSRRLLVTAGELADLFASLPRHLPVEFAPISMAWLGTSAPMRVSGTPPSIYDSDGNNCKADEPGAHLDIHLLEDY